MSTSRLRCSCVRRAALCAALLVHGAESLPAPVAAGEPELVRLTHEGAFKQHLAWSPDGRQLLFAEHHGKHVWLMQWTASHLSPRRISGSDAVELYPTWSPDSKRIAYSQIKFAGTQGNFELLTANPDGTEPKLFAGDLDGKLSMEEAPAWSPDGKSIAFTSTAEGNQELYVSPLGGAPRLRLTQDSGLDQRPHWSPDSRHLVFSTSRWGDLEIARIQADGTQLQRLTTSRGVDDYPRWSPDGRYIAFTSHRDGNFEIYVMAADGKQPVNISRHEEIDNFPAWTPDGKLTFVSNRDGKFDVYLLPDGERYWRSGVTNPPPRVTSGR